MTEPQGKNEPREPYILGHITDAMFEIDVGVGVVPDAATWAEIPLPPARFGWTEPIDMADDDGKISPMVLICPEIIARVTANLSNPDLDAYLDVVEIKMAAARHPGLEAELFDKAPNSVALWNDTDAKALDLGIVPSG